MDKQILLDTNVVRRLLENDTKTIHILDYYFFHKYLFIISDYSLFEIYDYLDNLSVNKEQLKFKLIILFNRYKIKILYRQSSEFLQKNFKKFITNQISIYETKNILLKSFSYALSSFLTNIFSITLLYLANSLEQKFNTKQDSMYNSTFYQYIRTIYTNEYIYNHIKSNMEKIIERSYISNEFKIQLYIDKYFKKIIIEVLCYHHLYSNSATISEKIFKSAYQTISNNYQNLNYKDILKKFILPNSLTISNKYNMTQIDYDYIVKYINKLIFENGAFKVNDITDYLNFSNSFDKNILYYTQDTKSLSKYSNYFSENIAIIKHLEKLKKIDKIPYYVFYFCSKKSDLDILREIISFNIKWIIMLIF